MQVLEIKTVTIATHAIAGTATGHFDFDGLCPPIHQLPYARLGQPEPV